MLRSRVLQPDYPLQVCLRQRVVVLILLPVLAVALFAVPAVVTVAG